MRSVFLFGLASWLLLVISPELNAQQFQAGVGRADITPNEPIWMGGYSGRSKPSEGVDRRLFLKALALREQSKPAFLLITADILGFPAKIADSIANRVHSELHVPRENFMLVASHTHTGPVVAERHVYLYGLADKEARVIADYTKSLEDQALAAAAAAIADMRPAQLAFSRGRATFGVNRRVFRSNGTQFGVNPDGPTDSEVPVLCIGDDATKVRALVFGYGCHCTSFGGKNNIDSDWAGRAQEHLERTFPGATALFIPGCGGDVGPVGSVDANGLELAGAVAQAIRASRRMPIAPPLTSLFERTELPLAALPSRDELEKRLQSTDNVTRRHARWQLDQLDLHGKLPSNHPCPIQVWQFGQQLTLIALGGEVVVDYSLRLKRELAGTNIWLASYANDHCAYLPSVRILLEGGYEADSSTALFLLPSRFSPNVEDILVANIRKMCQQLQPNGTTNHSQPGETNR